MKKILALTLALIVVLSLCACGNTSAGGADEPPNAPAGNSGSADGADAGSDSAGGNSGSTDGAGSDSAGSSQDTGYVGTWKVIPPDDNPFPPIVLVINEDGTATWNGEPRFWYESLDPKEPEGAIEIAREDNMGYGDDAYITEDGKLYMEKNMTVGNNSYDHLFFERQ